MLNGSLASAGFFRPSASNSSRLMPSLAMYSLKCGRYCAMSAGGYGIEANGHGRVRGEDVARPRRPQGVPERHATIFHEAARAFQDDERSVPLVHVAHVDVEVHGLQGPPAADAQHELLHQPELRTSPVQLAGDAAIDRAVHRIIAVQQVQGDSTDLRLPHPEHDGPSRKIERHVQPSAGSCLRRLDREARRDHCRDTSRAVARRRRPICRKYPTW